MTFKRMLCLFLLLMTFGLMQTACADGLSTAYVNNPDPADRLHLRTSMSVNSTSLGKYYNGTAVTVISEQNGWTQVQIGTLNGYMQTRYLSDQPVTSAQPSVKINNKEGSGLNLRYGQNTSTRSLGLYKNGTKVTVLGLTESWCHVEVDGKTGFMVRIKLSPTPQYDLNADAGTSANTRYVNNPNTNDRLHLRMGASTESLSLGKYYNGTPVTVLSEQNGWAYVQIGALDGYMWSRYLSKDYVQSAQPIVTVDNVSGTGLHLRAGQSTDSTDLGLYKNGTQAVVLGLSEGWCHVEVDGKMGFMLREKLTPKLKFDLSK